MEEARYRDAERRLWEFYGLAPKESSIRLAQLGAHIRVQELGDGPPVLFIHGGPNAGATWAPLLEFFSGYRCFVVDRPGTGLSKPFPLNADTLPRFSDLFVRDVLTALGVERAHVVASALGGYIALRSAAAHPGRICRMVQMACPAFAPGNLMPGFMKLMTIGPVRLLLNALPQSERIGWGLLRQVGHGASLDSGRIPRPFFEWYDALVHHTDTMRHDSDLIAACGSVRGFDRSLTMTDDLLASVLAPTLFLWGGDDAFGGIGVASHLVSRMGNAELETMPDAGHLPWLDDPKSVALAATDFLAAGTP
jgi:pimeloyl-ACP methyl ester carboxylesterase